MAREVGDTEDVPPALREKAKRLFVDMSIISQRDSRTGIQRVVRSIWNRLASAVGSDVLIVPVSGHGGAGYRALPDDWNYGDSLTSDLQPISPGKGDIFLGLDLAVRHLPECEKQFAAWKRDGLLIYLVVYDLLPIRNWRWFRLRAVWNFRRWLGFLARRADGVICISADVAAELNRWLERHSPERLDAIKSHVVRPADNIEDSLPSVGLPAHADAIVSRMRQVPTLLMVGTVEPRKGYGVALDAVEHIWRGCMNPPLDLIIVGRQGWKTRGLQSRMRRLASEVSHFKWLEDVSDEFLRQLYRECAGLVVCSYAEGYGLPVAEALRLGVPVLARDIPIFREIVGGRLRYFEQDDPVSLSKAMLEFTDGSRTGRDSGAGASLPAADWEQVTNIILSHIERDTGHAMRR